jgi:hypothetical protein
MKRTSNPCVATCADGSKCGRRAPLGEQLCSIHKNGAPGKRFQPKPRTPKEIVEKLLTDSDPSVRLRALDMWIKHFEERTTDTGYRDFVKAMTDDERQTMAECLDWLHRIKEAVYARNPDLTIDDATATRRLQRTATASPVNAAPAQPVAQPPVAVEESDDTDDFELVSREDFDAEP